MYENMPEGPDQPAPANPPNRGSSCLPKFLFVWDILLYILTIGFVVFTILNWRNFSICFQRETAILSCCFLYWRFTQPKFPSVVWELFQFAIIFWIGEEYNVNDAQIHPNCLDFKGSLSLYMIKTIYTTLLISYTVSCAVFSLIFVIAVIMTIAHYCYFEPRRRRRRGLRGLQFGELEEIEYKKIKDGAPNEQHTCSICLVDFEENEKIIQLPLCNHYFHKECLKQWVQTNNVCPYCRANIKRNLKIWKRRRNGEEVGSIEMVPQDSQRSDDSSILRANNAGPNFII